MKIIKTTILILLLSTSIGYANNFIDLCVSKKLTCSIFIYPEYGVSYNFEVDEFNKNIKSEKQAINIINNHFIKQND